MSHYAKVKEGIVQQVIVASEDFFSKFVDTSAGEWIQTSYNTRGGIHYTNGQPSADQSKALRKNFAGVGSIYDSENDAFFFPQPYPSWTLNETTFLWEAPVAMPTDGKEYFWDEGTQSWAEAPTA